MFAQTLRVMVDIVLLRRGPQDMPSDWNLLAVLAALYLIVHFMQATVVASTSAALAQAALATGLLAVYARTILQVSGCLPRLVQTLTALFAVGTLASLILIGPTAVMGPIFEQLAQGVDPKTIQVPLFAVLAAIVVSIWLVIANAHIFRHAVDKSMGIGVLIAIGYEILLPVLYSVLASVI